MATIAEIIKQIRTSIDTGEGYEASEPVAEWLFINNLPAVLNRDAEQGLVTGITIEKQGVDDKNNPIPIVRSSVVIFGKVTEDHIKAVTNSYDKVDSIPDKCLFTDREKILAHLPIHSSYSWPSTAVNCSLLELIDSAFDPIVPVEEFREQIKLKPQSVPPIFPALLKVNDILAKKENKSKEKTKKRNGSTKENILNGNNSEIDETKQHCEQRLVELKLMDDEYSKRTVREASSMNALDKLLKILDCPPNESKASYTTENIAISLLKTIFTRKDSSIHDMLVKYLARRCDSFAEEETLRDFLGKAKLHSNDRLLQKIAAYVTTTKFGDIFSPEDCNSLIEKCSSKPLPRWTDAWLSRFLSTNSGDEHCRQVMELTKDREEDINAWVGDFGSEPCIRLLLLTDDIGDKITHWRPALLQRLAYILAETGDARAFFEAQLPIHTQIDLLFIAVKSHSLPLINVVHYFFTEKVEAQQAFVERWEHIRAVGPLDELLCELQQTGLLPVVLPVVPSSLCPDGLPDTVLSGIQDNHLLNLASLRLPEPIHASLYKELYQRLLEERASLMELLSTETELISKLLQDANLPSKTLVTLFKLVLGQDSVLHDSLIQLANALACTRIIGEFLKTWTTEELISGFALVYRMGELADTVHWKEGILDELYERSKTDEQLAALLRKVQPNLPSNIGRELWRGLTTGWNHERHLGFIDALPDDFCHQMLEKHADENYGCEFTVYLVYSLMYRCQVSLHTLENKSCFSGELINARCFAPFSFAQLLDLYQKPFAANWRHAIAEQIGVHVDIDNAHRIPEARANFSQMLELFQEKSMVETAVEMLLHILRSSANALSRETLHELFTRLDDCTMAAIIRQATADGYLALRLALADGLTNRIGATFCDMWYAPRPYEKAKAAILDFLQIIASFGEKDRDPYYWRLFGFLGEFIARARVQATAHDTEGADGFVEWTFYQVIRSPVLSNDTQLYLGMQLASNLMNLSPILSGERSRTVGMGTVEKLVRLVYDDICLHHPQHRARFHQLLPPTASNWLSTTDDMSSEVH